MKTLPRPADAPARPPATAPAPAQPAPAHQTDPVLAAALFAAWSGDPVVQVASPPGAGKTRLVTHLAEQLNRRAGLDVAIAAQTRAQALDVANRAADAGAAVTLLGRGTGKGNPRPVELHPLAEWMSSQANLRNHHGVLVATTQRWLHTSPGAWKADILIVDEAWQLTFADLGGLGLLAPQIVLVGDPGQIAPVVTGDTSRWEHSATGPHQPAPTALAAAYAEHITQLRIPHTWRLGPDTTSLLQPVFYPDLPFTSARPQQWMSIDNDPLPEISATPLTGLIGHTDPLLAAAAAATTRHLLATARTHGPTGSRDLSPGDIAVIAPHVDQTAMIAAHLADLDGILIGTINQTQGLEREAVVVVHPLCGYRELPDFATDTGRLCVALSRHRSHAHVLYDPQTLPTLTSALRQDPGNTALDAQRRILTRLTGK